MRKICSTLFIAGALLTLVSAAALGQDGGLKQAKIKELPNFSRVNERLYRGAQPRKNGFEKLAALGINTVINLRDDDQRALREGAEVKALGLRYFNVPLKELGRPSHAQVDQILSLIEAKENGVVFVHCRKGQDRTGTVIALYRITHDDWTAKQALKEAERFGMKFWQLAMKDYISDYSRDRSRGTTRRKARMKDEGGRMKQKPATRALFTPTAPSKTNWTRVPMHRDEPQG